MPSGENGTPSAERERRRILGRAGVIGGATMTSRVLGMVREHVFARLFGASAGIYSDAFMIAYRIPNLLRDLFAEGALSAAFVPTFTEYREKHGEARAFQLAQVVFTALFAVVGGITLIGVVFAPQLVDFIAPGFGDATGETASGTSKRDLTISLTRWMMPFLLLVSLAAVCRGILNTYHRYFLPALAPALFNLVAVATGFGMYWAGLAPETAVYGWATATLVGGAVTFLVQVPSLLGLGVRFRVLLTLGHEGFRRIVRMMGPATIGLAAVQANIVVNSALASFIGDGAVSWLNYAFRLVYLPVGVIGVAVATVSTVNLSARAARADLPGFRSDLITSLRWVAFFTLPATVGLIVLAEPITRLVYEYGEFIPEDTGATAAALICYGWALFFYSAVKVLAPAFYALGRLRIPVIASIVAVAINIGWSLATYRTWGHQALATGTAIAATVNFLILAIALRRSFGGIPPLERGLAGAAARMLVIALVAGIAAWGTQRVIDFRLGSDDILGRSIGVLVPIAIAIAVVIGLARLLRLPEARALAKSVPDTGDDSC